MNSEFRGSSPNTCIGISKLHPHSTFIAHTLHFVTQYSIIDTYLYTSYEHPSLRCTSLLHSSTTYSSFCTLLFTLPTIPHRPHLSLPSVLLSHSSSLLICAPLPPHHSSTIFLLLLYTPTPHSCSIPLTPPPTHHSSSIPLTN